MIGIALQAKVGETEEVKASRQQYAAYALQHEVGEDGLLLCSSFAGYLMSLDDKRLFQEILRSVGIVVHDKYLKKANWKDVLMEKLLFRIEKPLVRHYIQDLAAGAASAWWIA